jgi:hypothetical protein
MSCYNGGDNNWRLLLSYQVLDTHAVVAWRPATSPSLSKHQGADTYPRHPSCTVGRDTT